MQHIKRDCAVGDKQQEEKGNDTETWGDAANVQSYTFIFRYFTQNDGRGH